MANYHNVLVVVDASDEAKMVLARTIEITRNNLSEVKILHVLDLPETAYGDLMTVNLSDYTCSVRELVYPKIVEMAKEYNFPETTVSVQTGRTIDVIVDTAETLGADLIIMGSHGRHGISLLLGSTANGVLHRAKCDVLTVRIKD